MDIPGVKPLVPASLGLRVCCFQHRLLGDAGTLDQPFGLSLAQFAAWALPDEVAARTMHGAAARVVGITSISPAAPTLLREGDLILAVHGGGGEAWDLRGADAHGVAQALHAVRARGVAPVLEVLRPSPATRLKGVVATRVEEDTPCRGCYVKIALGVQEVVLVAPPPAVVAQDRPELVAELYDALLITLCGLRFVGASNYLSHTEGVVRAAEGAAAALEAQGRVQEAVDVLEGLPRLLESRGAVLPTLTGMPLPVTYYGCNLRSSGGSLTSLGSDLAQRVKAPPFNLVACAKPLGASVPASAIEAFLPEETLVTLPGMALVGDPIWRAVQQWEGVAAEGTEGDDGQGHADALAPARHVLDTLRPARAAVESCRLGLAGDALPETLFQPPHLDEAARAALTGGSWRAAIGYPSPAVTGCAFPPVLPFTPCGTPYGRPYAEAGYSGRSCDGTLSAPGFPLGVYGGALRWVDAVPTVPSSAPVVGPGSTARSFRSIVTRPVYKVGSSPSGARQGKSRGPGRPSKGSTKKVTDVVDEGADAAFIQSSESVSVITTSPLAGILATLLSLPPNVSGAVRFAYGPAPGPIFFAQLAKDGRVAPTRVQRPPLPLLSHAYTYFLSLMNTSARRAVGEGVPMENPTFAPGTSVAIAITVTPAHVDYYRKLNSLFECLRSGGKPAEKDMRSAFFNLHGRPASAKAHANPAGSASSSGAPTGVKGPARHVVGGRTLSKTPFWKQRGRKRGRGGRGRGGRGRGGRDDDEDEDDEDEEFDVTKEEGGKSLGRGGSSAGQRKSGREVKNRLDLSALEGGEEEEEEEEEEDVGGGEEGAAMEEESGKTPSKAGRKSAGGGGGSSGGKGKKGTSLTGWAHKDSIAHEMVGGDAENQLAKAPGEKGVLAYKIDRIMAVRYADLPDPEWDALPPVTTTEEEDERWETFYRRQLTMRMAMPLAARRAWETCEYLIKWRGLSYQHTEWAAVTLLQEQGIWGPIRAKRFLETPEAAAQLEDEESRMALGKEPPAADTFYDEDWGTLDRILHVRPVWHDPVGDGRIDDKAAFALGMDKALREDAAFKAGWRKDKADKPWPKGPWCDETKPFGPKPTPTSTLRNLCLVKWRGLAYVDCTWEWLDEMKDDAAYKAYLAHNTVPEDVLTRAGSFYVPSGLRWPDGEPRMFDVRPEKPLVLNASPTYKGSRTLREYQVTGLNWIVHNWHGRRDCILADEMGLGKTIQSVVVLDHLNKSCGVHGPFLVVVPLSTMGNWKRSFEEWTDLNVVYYHDAMGGADARQIIRNFEFDYSGPRAAEAKAKSVFKFHVLLTSYQVLMADFHELIKIQWRYVIIDEAHALKNTQSKLQEAMLGMRRDALLLLTGTPLQNETAELWSLVNLVAPDKFPSKVDFAVKFGELKSSDQVAALIDELGPILLRRVKEDVEKSIPPKEETVIAVELTRLQKAYYRAIFDRNRTFLARGATSSAPVANLISIEMELRKCCNHPFLLRNAEQREVSVQATKTERCDAMVAASGKMVLLDKLLPHLRENDHRVLIFSQFKGMLGLIELLLQSRQMKYERIDGSIRGNDRQAAIDRFNKAGSDSFAFLLSTKAGGQGINLTAADTVIIYDSDWNPQNDLQAMARAHRIGQTKDVRVFRLVTTKTYEAEMFKRSSMKLGLAQALFESGKKSGSMGAAALGEEEGADASGILTMDRDKVEALLRFGAYAIMDDEETGGAADAFQASSIEAILGRSVTMRYEGDGTAKAVSVKSGGGVETGGRGGSSSSSGVSKTNFSANEGDQGLDVKDPSFWDKVLGPRPANALLKTLTTDGVLDKVYTQEDPAGVRAAQWVANITALLDDVYEAKNENIDHEGLEPASMILDILKDKGKGVPHPLSPEALSRRPHDLQSPALPSISPEIKAMLGANAILSAAKRTAYAAGKGERPASDEDGVQHDGDLMEFAQWWVEKLDASRRQRKRSRVMAVFADNESSTRKTSRGRSPATATPGVAGTGRRGRGRGRPRGRSIAAQAAMGMRRSPGGEEGEGGMEGLDGSASAPNTMGLPLGFAAPPTASGLKRSRGFDPGTGLDVGEIEADRARGIPSISNLRLRIAPWKALQPGARYAADIDAARNSRLAAAGSDAAGRAAASALTSRRMSAKPTTPADAMRARQALISNLHAQVMSDVGPDGILGEAGTAAKAELLAVQRSVAPVADPAPPPSMVGLKLKLTMQPAAHGAASAGLAESAAAHDASSAMAVEAQHMSAPLPPTMHTPAPSKETGKFKYTAVIPESLIVRTGPRRAEVLAAFSAGVPVAEWMEAVELHLPFPTRETSLAAAQASAQPHVALSRREAGIMETGRLARWHLINRTSKGDALRPLGLAQADRVPEHETADLAAALGLWSPPHDAQGALSFKPAPKSGGGDAPPPVRSSGGGEGGWVADTSAHGKDIGRKLASRPPDLVRMQVQPLRCLLAFSPESGFSIKPDVIKGPRIRAPMWAVRGVPVDTAEETKAQERRIMTARKFQEAKARKIAAGGGKVKRGPYKQRRGAVPVFAPPASFFGGSMDVEGSAAEALDDEEGGEGGEEEDEEEDEEDDEEEEEDGEGDDDAV